jgi:hypothetical protein
MHSTHWCALIIWSCGTGIEKTSCPAVAFTPQFAKVAAPRSSLYDGFFQLSFIILDFMPWEGLYCSALLPGHVQSACGKDAVFRAVQLS